MGFRTSIDSSKPTSHNTQAHITPESFQYRKFDFISQSLLASIATWENHISSIIPDGLPDGTIPTEHHLPLITYRLRLIYRAMFTLRRELFAIYTMEEDNLMTSLASLLPSHFLALSLMALTHYQSLKIIFSISMKEWHFRGALSHDKPSLLITIEKDLAYIQSSTTSTVDWG